MRGDSCMSQRLVKVCKRLVVTVGVVAALIAPTMGVATTSPVFTSPAYAVAKSSTVYRTRTGSCYHKGSCRHLRQSKIKTNVVKAKKLGLRACKVCRLPSK